MEQKARLHPLVATAAISVTVFSLAGIGAMTGLLPRSIADRAPAPVVLPAPAAPAAATVALVEAAADPLKDPAPVVAPAPAPAAELRPAPRKARATPRKAVQVAEAKTVAVLPPPPPVAAPAPVTDATPVAAPVAPPEPVAAAPKPACADCGTVESFRQIEVKGDASAVGTVAGGAAGAIIGHQFGRGSGRDLMTIAGAVGGALAGREIEKNTRKKTRYEVSVRMDDGSLVRLSQDAAPAWRVGEHVRVIDKRIVAAS